MPNWHNSPSLREAALLAGNVADSFWAKVEKGAGCWSWSGPINDRGYGIFWYKKKSHRAHRVACLLSGRELPQMPFVSDHVCRNRGCVNPDHIEFVSSRVNTLRGEGPSAENFRKETCNQGHPLDGIKSGRNGVLHRYCKQCNRDKNHRWYSRRRAGLEYLASLPFGEE